MGKRQATMNASEKLTPTMSAEMDKPPMEEDALRSLFQALDPEGTGQIDSSSNFLKALSIFGGDGVRMAGINEGTGAVLPNSELALFVKEMGMDAQGSFNYEEYLAQRKVLIGRK